jgi:2-polyprenyl-3-methyl-5-hydroxy-6-metoxy-1,4-benzoquinol methylase
MIRLCNLCGTGLFKTVEDGEKPFLVLKCLGCGLFFVDPLPDPAFLATHYDAGYYSDWLGKQKTRRLQMWERRLRKIEHYAPKGRLLDVGCATGDFLHLARKKGWRISGTEYSLYAASFARDFLQTDIFCGELMDAPFADSFFDVATLWHVLEHVTDPTRYLQTVRRLLKPSGLLVIAVPNVQDYVMRIAYRIVKGRPLRLFSSTDREIHLYHFSAETLQHYLRKTGFHCRRLSPDYGITDDSKRLINALAVVLSHATGLKLFNTLEVYATRD